MTIVTAVKMTHHETKRWTPSRYMFPEHPYGWTIIYCACRHESTGDTVADAEAAYALHRLRSPSKATAAEDS